MPHGEHDVTARPITWPLDKIFAALRWALALAWRWRGGCSLASPLTITLLLGTPSLLAVGAGSVTAAGPPASPPRGLLATGITAIACLGPGRGEEPFTALEQAATGSPPPAGPWP
jgi:hypothetical protein